MKLNFPAVFLLPLLLSACASASEYTDGQYPALGRQLMEKPVTVDGIRVLSVVKLGRLRFNDIEMVELSALAWSEDEQLLYAVSDHGAVFHLAPVFSSGRLQSVRVIHAYLLRDKDGKVLGWPWRDSEGLVVLNANNGRRGDDELVISYELRPRIMRHSVQGKWLADIELPVPLRDRSRYQSWNKALEAVAVHPEFGVLSAPERPLSDAPKGSTMLYSDQGIQWAIPQQEDGLSVVAMEVMPAGDILLLQRRHRMIGEVWKVVLQRLGLKKSGRLDSRVLATLSSNGEQIPVDNYEGLARHEGNRYFMVSDDNESLLQDMLLMYFEVLSD